MIRLAISTLAIGTAMVFAAQPAEAQRNERVLIVYGDDDCPTSNGEEIVVCARLPEGERYRIPQPLRDTRDQPADMAWAARAEAVEYVGRTGTMSCSPVGPGGFTGCTEQMLRAARSEGGALFEF